MPVDVGALAEYLNLEFDRADFQKRGIRENYVALFAFIAKKKIDRIQLQNFDITVVLGIDHAVFNLLDWQVCRSRIQIPFRLRGRLFPFRY